MKEVKHYICEICDTEYNTKLKAQECEKSHKKPVGIGKCKYLPVTQNAKGYPKSIEVDFGKGDTVMYCR